MIWAILRMLGALGVVAALIAGGALAYRRLAAAFDAHRPAWLGRFAGTFGPAAQLRVTTRAALGARESVAVVVLGGERFLLGVAAGGVSLLARLDPEEDTAPAISANDFTSALSGAQTTRSDDEKLRFAIRHSRERLVRLRRRPELVR